MDKVRAMRAYVAVVESASFTQAAERLGMPKATVSGDVTQLEALLRVRLLQRTTRRVTVTAEGAAYYERCVRILEDIRDAEETVSLRNGRPSGRLRVDVGTAVATRLLIPALPSFFERYPDIELELGCSDRRINLIHEGVDCALRGGDILDESLVARRVGTLHLVTCAAPGYLARHGRPTHPRDLLRHACLGYFAERSGGAMDWDFQKDGERILLPIPSRLALNDANAYIEACLHGLGIAQLPTSVFNQYLECGALELLLGEWMSEPIPFHVVYPSSRHLSGKVRAFVEWVAETFEQHTGLQMCAPLRCTAGQAGQPRTADPAALAA
jgi:LysR family transcriptional regulator for bpeEF and oprC